MENKKLTAVEWFFDKLENHEIQAKHYDLYQQAKAMEKDQIAEAFNNSYWFIDGIEYYEKTYGK
jgi:hypothetical protein